MPAPAVLIHVQHLLGVGHLKRAAALARAFVESGLDVTLLSGGMAADVALGGARLIQLEPLRAADTSFSTLIDAHGAPIDDALRERRRHAVLDAFARIKPQALVTEMFPFGRRQLRFELMPLLEAARAARPRPLIISSVRDILVQKDKPERIAEMAALAREFYDHVLVHGDEGLLPFGASFPRAGEIADLIVHTGYVASESGVPAPAGEGADEIIVSAGGGAVGRQLIEAALGAHALVGLAARRRRWRLLAGGNLDDAIFRTLQSHAAEGIVIERARGDFPALLGRAALSVSQAGYNTVMDVLGAKVRAVLVPFAAGRETEQDMRALALAARGRAIVVPESALTAARLAAAIDEALALPPPGPSPVALDGAERSAQLLNTWLRR